ncbi:DUF1810 domain-containing protein [Massilia sp. BJB1822]|uniref:DUF1810 domain-containing protein n=1 Tax=Massilia sp. BJB1822 TaxID=2744470 RepID=UPI00159316F1|nr:DUF1810 domain-containing protein [Massilia sp. BJB1822]NVE01668.1 DUF1810 domain-containing protein [Massilia sp. BJB1822]
MGDIFDLQRFISAQRDVYPSVLDELRAGCKRSHWMWFIFPQIAGLGHSAMAQRYALSGLDEARAYLDHALLGARLRECCALLLQAEHSAHAIFGATDEMKLRSSLTLFAAAAPAETLFAACLRQFFDGRPDAATLQRLS